MQDQRSEWLLYLYHIDILVEPLTQKYELKSKMK